MRFPAASDADAMQCFAVAQRLVAEIGALAVVAVVGCAMWLWETRYDNRGADALLLVLGGLMGALILAVIVQGRHVPIGGYLLAAIYFGTGWAIHTRRRNRGDS